MFLYIHVGVSPTPIPLISRSMPKLKAYQEENWTLFFMVMVIKVSLPTAPFNNAWTLKFKALPTKLVFCYRQSNVRQLLPASDYCRALFCCLNWAQRFHYRTLCSSWSWEELPHIWLTVVKNDFVGWAMNFRVHTLLKGAVGFSAEVTLSWTKLLKKGNIF